MRTILQIDAGRVVVVLRQTAMGTAAYVVENHGQRFNDRSACVATSRAGVLAVIDALKSVAEAMS